MKYLKFFTRDLSVLSVDMWFKAERDGMRKLFPKEVSFAPLFINEGRGVNIYYGISPENEKVYRYAESYFVEHPEEFKKFAEGFSKLCDEYKNKLDFNELIEYYFEFYPRMIVTIFIVNNKDVPDAIRNSVIELRNKSEKIEYEVYDKLEENAKKLVEDAEYMTVDEIKAGGADVSSRKEGWIYYNEKLITGNTEEFCKENEIELIKPEAKETNEVKGMCAMKGKHVGKVRIVYAEEEGSNIEEGEVLVTPMTSPNYIAAIERAGAIVTDEGGITCHAAIVSRELNKPCVIGTKHATLAFKDGDIVEVDADKGIVRKI